MKKTLLIAGVVIGILVAVILMFVLGIFSTISSIILLKAPTIIGQMADPPPTNISIAKEAIIFYNSKLGHICAVDAVSHKLKWSLNSFANDYMLIGESIYVTTQNGVLRINASTGVTEQIIKIEEDPSYAPVVAGNTLVLREFEKERLIFAHDLKTGKKLWNFTTRKYITDCLSAGGGIICVGTTFNGFAPSKPDSDVYGLDAKTGKKLWSIKVGHTDSPATFYKGIIYLASPPAFGGLDAIDARSGKRLWHFDDIIGCSGSKPAISGDTVYVCSSDNSLYAVDIKTGKEKWHTSGSSESSNIIAPVVLDDNTAYFVNTSEELYAINKINGKERWHVLGYGTEGNSALAVSGDAIYIGENGKLCALNKKDGTLKWEYYLSGDKKRNK